LAFIGGLAAQSRIKLDHLNAVANSLVLFAFGIVAALTGMILAYFTNYVTAAVEQSFERAGLPPFVRPGKRTRALVRVKVTIHIAATLVGLASIALFVWGVFDVRNAISHLRGGAEPPL
jgi:hypothetical protein